MATLYSKANAGGIKKVRNANGVVSLDESGKAALRGAGFLGGDTSFTFTSGESAIPIGDVGSSVNVGGSRFIRDSLGDLTEYTLESEKAFYPDSLINQSNTTTAWQQVGSVDLPADSLARSQSTKISFGAIASGSLANVQLGVLIANKSGARTQSKYYTVRDLGAGAGASGSIEFTATPLHSSLLQLAQVSVGTAPTSYPDSSVKNVFSSNFIAGVRVSFFVKFPSTGGTLALISSTAQVTVTPRIRNQIDLSVLRAHPARAPFPDNDVWKSRLPANSVAYSEVVAANPGTTGDTSTGYVNASGTAGSDILTVHSTTGVTVGMWPMIGVQGKVQGSSAFDAMRPHFPSAVDSYNAFGAGTTVIAIVNATQVQLSQPLKTNVSLRGQIWSGGEAMNCVAFYRAPETACVRYGQGSNTLTVSPFTGVQKVNTAATAARSMVPVVRIRSTDPVRSWQFSSFNANNAWPFDYPAANVAGSLEVINNATFQIKTPSYLTQAYLENGPQNSDKNLILITECGRFSIEMIGVNMNVTPATATRAIFVDLTRKSYPTLDQYDLGHLSNGTRAYGGPLIGGVIRKWELDQCYDSGNVQADIARAMQAISHPIAILMGNAQGKSNNYCPDPAVQGTRVNYKSYRSTNSVHAPSIFAGGTGYKVGDALYVTGGTFTTPVSCVVSTVSAGAVTSVHVQRTGQYKTLPADLTQLATTSSGSGTGCVLNALSIPTAPDQTTSSVAFPDITNLGQVCQYPATIADNGYTTNYAGVLPMGAMFTIPKSLDLASIWTSRRSTAPTALSSSFELLAVLSAIQRHGAIVVDVSGSYQQMLVVDDEVAYSSTYSNLHGDTGSSTYPNLELIKRLLIYVENTSPLHRSNEYANNAVRLCTLN